MRRIREDLTDPLGSDVTPAEAILIEEAAKTALILKATGDAELPGLTPERSGA